MSKDDGNEGDTVGYFECEFVKVISFTDIYMISAENNAPPPFYIRKKNDVRVMINIAEWFVILLLTEMTFGF